MSASISATTGSYRLELGGQSLSVNAIEGGGAVGVVISGPPTGGAPFREKHLAGCGMNQLRLLPRSAARARSSIIERPEHSSEIKRWGPMSGPKPRTFEEIVAAQGSLKTAPGGEWFVDPTINSFHAEVSVNEDRDGTGEWRVEYFDNDGGCYVTIFAGPEAAQRARAYFQALKGKSLKTIRAHATH